MVSKPICYVRSRHCFSLVHFFLTVDDNSTEFKVCLTLQNNEKKFIKRNCVNLANLSNMNVKFDWFRTSRTTKRNLRSFFCRIGILLMKLKPMKRCIHFHLKSEPVWAYSVEKCRLNFLNEFDQPKTCLLLHLSKNFSFYCIIMSFCLAIASTSNIYLPLLIFNNKIYILIWVKRST